MKRMVKNGDLLDIEPDGTITAGGKAINAVEANPTGEATETLTKLKVGETTYGVEGGGGGGGGGDYTAGRNIEISEAKEISLKSDITGINSFKFAGNSSPVIGVLSNGNLKIKSNSSDFEYPAFYLYRYGYSESSDKVLGLIFRTDVISNGVLFFDMQGFGDMNYAFITKGAKVPPVPSENGTYVLKATVSGSTITYTWVAG